MAKTMKGVTSTTRNGAVYWYARIGGKRVYCGKDAEGRKLAEAARAKELAQKYENREINAGLTVRRPDLRTVRDLANWYMELPSVQEQRSFRRKTEVLAHLLGYFGNVPLHQVDGDALERYRTKRRGEGAAHATVNLEMHVLGAMFHLAGKRKKVMADHVPGEFPQVNDRNPRPVITETQFKRILAAVDQDFQDVLTCAYESAMRSGEIRTLTKRQVHLNSRHISGMIVDYLDLGIFDTKTGARRTVPVSAALKAILERRTAGLGPDDTVFTYQGKDDQQRVWTTTFISNRFADTCRNLGIPFGDAVVNEKGERIGIVFHCFRHTRISKWVEMGFSDEIIRRASGHSSLEAYRTYIKLDPWAVMRLVNGRHTDDIKTSETLENAAC
jgi:integrase